MMIINVTEEFEGKLMMGEHVSQANVMLQKEFTNLQISADTVSVIENSTVDIECSFEGGSPKPDVTFLLMDNKGLFRNS